MLLNIAKAMINRETGFLNCLFISLHSYLALAFR
jgi:hypothetical protein